MSNQYSKRERGGEHNTKDNKEEWMLCQTLVASV